MRRVLQHLIESEWHYARLVARLRGLPAPPSVEERELPASVTEAVRMLTASRRALIAALEDINEASFYRLGTVGREEYSVLSVLENAAHHDREHAQQIQIATAS